MLNFPIWTLFAPSLKAIGEKMTPWLIMQVRPKWPNFKGYWPKWPWRCRSRSPIFNRCWKLSKIHILCKFGQIPSNTFWLIARTSQNWQNSKFSRAEWPWRCRSRSPIINRCRKLGRINMHTKFGNIPSNGFWLNARTSQIYRRTDGQTQATTIPLRPERPRGKNE